MEGSFPCLYVLHLAVNRHLAIQDTLATMSTMSGQRDTYVEAFEQ